MAWFGMNAWGEALDGANAAISVNHAVTGSNEVAAFEQRSD